MLGWDSQARPRGILKPGSFIMGKFFSIALYERTLIVGPPPAALHLPLAIINYREPANSRHPKENRKLFMTKHTQFRTVLF